MSVIDQLWVPYSKPIKNPDDYVKSLHGRKLNAFYMGQRVEEPAEHPILKPLINAVAETYRLAVERPELGNAVTRTGRVVNRFLHIVNKPEDLLAKHDMQRELGRRTGTCFQRCVGVDAFGACHIVTFDMDAKNGTGYNEFSGFCGSCAGYEHRWRHEEADPAAIAKLFVIKMK